MNHGQNDASLEIRLMRKEDNAVVAEIIRKVMTEFGAVGCGYSINDSEIDDMHTAYSPANSTFFVVVLNGRVLGCGGFGPLTAGDPDICELRKMYFKTELRGLGAGTKLLKLCLDEARRAGFHRCYLETMDTMEQAFHLYGKHGFESLDQPLGNTGHTSCGAWMAMEL